MAKTYEEFRRLFDGFAADIKLAATLPPKHEKMVADSEKSLKKVREKFVSHYNWLSLTQAKREEGKPIRPDDTWIDLRESAQGLIAKRDEDVEKMEHMTESQFGRMRKVVTDLRASIAAEIAARKKQVSTKLGTGNKSLPDMEKLLREIDTFMTSAPFKTLQTYAPTAPTWTMETVFAIPANPPKRTFD